MKKALFPVVILLLLLAVASCPGGGGGGDGDGDDDEAIDPRLIGNWYTQKYRITGGLLSNNASNHNVIISNNDDDEIYEISIYDSAWLGIIFDYPPGEIVTNCYTEDGILYFETYGYIEEFGYEDLSYRPLLKYEIPESWPYLDGGSPDFSSFNNSLKTGKLIIVFLYNPDGTLHDESIGDEDYVWLLRRQEN
jgi:hypothetical protein